MNVWSALLARQREFLAELERAIAEDGGVVELENHRLPLDSAV